MSIISLLLLALTILVLLPCPVLLPDSTLVSVCLASTPGEDWYLLRSLTTYNVQPRPGMTAVNNLFLHGAEVYEAFSTDTVHGGYVEISMEIS